MNKKQRVLDCIDGKPIDRVPFSFWHHYAGADNYGAACRLNGVSSLLKQKRGAAVPLLEENIVSEISCFTGGSAAQTAHGRRCSIGS